MYSQKDVLYQQVRFQDMVKTAQRDLLAQRLSACNGGTRRQARSWFSGVSKPLAALVKVFQAPQAEC